MAEDISESTGSTVQLQNKDEPGPGRSRSFTSSKVVPEPLDIIESPSYATSEDSSSRSSTPSLRQHLKQMYMKVAIGVLILILLLILILVPLGYNELEYYEMGLFHNKMTGYVDTSLVYFAGRHWLGVNRNFKIYPAISQREVYNNVWIFNKERIEVTLTFSFTYQLRYEDLGTLHEIYGEQYQPIIRSSALAALKGAAAKFSINDYRLKRSTVAKGLSDAIALAISGKCCRKDCFLNECQPHCMVYWKCDKGRDIGYFSVLRYFQLHRIDLTEAQRKRFLKEVIQQELEDIALFQQEEKMVCLQTEQLRLEFSNNAAEVIQNATAEGSLLRLQAVAGSEQLIDSYRSQGLKHVYDALNVTNEEHKKSLDYVITLRNQTKANFYLGFQYMVANP